MKYIKKYESMDFDDFEYEESREPVVSRIRNEISQIIYNNIEIGADRTFLSNGDKDWIDIIEKDSITDTSKFLTKFINNIYIEIEDINQEIDNILSSYLEIKDGRISELSVIEVVDGLYDLFDYEVPHFITKYMVSKKINNYKV